MESPEGKISSTPTKVLFVPKLPPSLSDWNTLKTHFSKFGVVTSAIVNPQQRWCTVSFKTVAEAKFAKAIGCAWKNKTFVSHFWVDNDKSSSSLDPQNVVTDILSYSDLEAEWNDDDVENFGVVKNKRASSEKTKEKSRSISRERKEKAEVLAKMFTKGQTDKSDILPKISKDKVLMHSEKMSKIKTVDLVSLRDKQKEIKKKVKSISMQTSRKKHLKSAKIKEEKVRERSPSKSETKLSKLSLKEKFAILEERDKCIRKSFVKSSSVKCKAVVGTCPDMCPEKERIMREYRRLVAIYEMIPGTQSMDHSLAVKAYVRSSADQEEPLPHELRPEPVLSMTMSYLINEIMPLIDEPDVDISDWYDFCWDRLRGIRKDIIQQQLCDLETVTIIEQCARFHICCYDRFWGIDPLIFDEKINTENLMNCLQSLRHMYEDLRQENIKCPNEAEFNAYMILLNMKTGDLMGTYQQLSENFQKEERIQLAVKIYLVFNNSMYSQFFKLVKKSTYLDSCLLQRYFYHVRVQALQAIARAYSQPKKEATIPLQQMKEILKFNRNEDTKLFCEGHGILLKKNKEDFRLYRNDFFFPENKITVKNSSLLVTEKRLPLVKAVVGNGYYFRDYKNHQVHSSFTKDGKLSHFASDASDQKIKSSGMFMEATEKMDEVDDAIKIELDDAETIDENVMCTDEAEDKFDEMDVEEITLANTEKFSSMRSVPDEKHNFFNNDTVSGKQQTSSAFRFNLKRPAAEFKQFNETENEVGGPFKFSLGSTLFDNKNVLFPFPSQSNQNQFNLNSSVEKNTLGSLPSEKEKNYFEIKHIKMENDDTNKAKKSPIKKHFNLDFGQTADSFHSVIFSEKIEPENQLSSDIENKNEVFDQVKTAEVALHSPTSSLRHGFIKENESKEGIKMKNEDVVTTEKHFLADSVDGVKFNQFSFGEKIPKKNEFFIESDVCIKKKEENERLRLENERILKMLKKDLKRRMKAITARHFIRKWKQKVDKIKKARKEFPLLIPVSAEQHSSVWGSPANFSSVSGCSLLNRLKEKRHNIKVVNAILDDRIQHNVPYMGDKITESIINSSSFKLNLRDFNIPVCWKLIVSIPVFQDNEFFVNKFKNFLTKLFYETDNSILGSVVKENSWQNRPVYHCVHLITGSDFHKDKVTGMSGLIFFTISGVENSYDKCKRLKNLLASDKTGNQTPVALMKIGKENNDAVIKLLNEKLRKGKICGYLEEYWNDINSVQSVLKFLADNINLSSNVCVNTLNSLLKRMSEHISDFLNTAQILSNEFKTALLDPNVIITFYNSFFISLESMILDSNFKVYNVVPTEFKQFVEYLNKPGESLVDTNFIKTRRPSIVKAFSKINLPNLKPWPPHDPKDFLNAFDLYCSKINCSNILPRIIRIVDFKDNDDDFDFVKHVSTEVPWLSIVDVVINNLLCLNCEDNKKIVVICDKNDINDLCCVDFGFKLLQCIIDKS